MQKLNIELQLMLFLDLFSLELYRLDVKTQLYLHIMMIYFKLS